MAIRVQAEDFDIGAELAALTDGDVSIGGVTSFVGLVREMGSGPSAMTLEHYPGMTERQLAEIEAEAHARWPLQASLIIHRYGRLEAHERGAGAGAGADAASGQAAAQPRRRA